MTFQWPSKELNRQISSSAQLEKAEETACRDLSNEEEEEVNLINIVGGVIVALLAGIDAGALGVGAQIEPALGSVP